MASDFSVARQCLSKRTIGFLLQIKLHTLIWLGVSQPSFDNGAQNGVTCGSRQTHQSLKKIGLAEAWTLVSQMTHWGSIHYIIHALMLSSVNF
jgi:hypothetical protein